MSGTASLARTVPAWVAVALLVTGCAVGTVVAITTETGVGGLLVGGALAAVPVVPVVAAFLWLDRYEAEPPSLLAFSFAWGAGVATFGAIVVNTASVQAIRASGGDPTAAAILVAPVTEEALKGLAVLLLLVLRRREFDGVVDGIVYAGMTGIGFAFVENVLYLGRALTAYGGQGAAFVFVLRCVVSPFAHPLFTAATGVGLGIAAHTRRPALRLVAPLAGFAVAVLLHAAWNLSAASGLSGFVAVYVVVQVPVFGAFALLAVLARRRERGLLERHLPVYGRTGWLSPAEVTMLTSLSSRREARRWARQRGGVPAARAMRTFQAHGSELAFLRERLVHGTAPAGARATEEALLAELTALRAGFTGHRHRGDVATQG